MIGKHFRTHLLTANAMGCLAPLRTALLAELAIGDQTVAKLQDHALLETIYRRPHVRQALPAMLRDGLADRNPPGGQLTTTTRIRITVRGRAVLTQRHTALF